MAHLGLGNLCGSTTAAVDALFTKQSDNSLARDVGGGLSVVRVTEDSPLLPAVIDVIARSECGTTDTPPGRGGPQFNKKQAEKRLYSLMRGRLSTFVIPPVGLSPAFGSLLASLDPRHS